MSSDNRRQAQGSSLLRSAEPDTVATTLLFVHRSDPRRLMARPNRPWRRLLARLLGSSLDARLARGHSPDSGLLMAARAQYLVSPVVRTTLAQGWNGLLIRARMPPVPLDPRVPLMRSNIVAHEPKIREMLTALLAPLPVPARGVALAGQLLCDGAGPLYDRRRSAELDAALSSTIAALDPARELIGPTEAQP
jgi:hypothetical protein